jgi:hypothetical protein
LDGRWLFLGSDLSEVILDGIFNFVRARPDDASRDEALPFSPLFGLILGLPEIENCDGVCIGGVVGCADRLCDITFGPAIKTCNPRSRTVPR